MVADTRAVRRLYPVEPGVKPSALNTMPAMSTRTADTRKQLSSSYTRPQRQADRRGTRQQATGTRNRIRKPGVRAQE
jgi:hypothetical protein